MKLYQFPPGGRDLLDDEPRQVPVETVRSLLPAARGSDDLTAQLERALRTEAQGMCALGLSTEVGLLKYAASC